MEQTEDSTLPVCTLGSPGVLQLFAKARRPRNRRCTPADSNRLPGAGLSHERCKRAPTAMRRSFTGSCWPRRLLSVTTFRADVAPPHVGSPSVRTRVAGAAKMGGSLPAVALSSREARADRLCNASRSVRPVFLGAALVGWCQTMNMKCVVAGFLLRYSRRHARLPFSLLRAVGPARRVSPLFVNGLMKPRTNVEPKWSSRRGSNPHAATTSRRTVGARVLRVSRSGTVQI